MSISQSSAVTQLQWWDI